MYDTAMTEQISNISVSPYTKNVEVEGEILTRLRNITNNSTYLNLTSKSTDELKAFVYSRNIAQSLATGTSEELEETYSKERASGLEYQDDVQYHNSCVNTTHVLKSNPSSTISTKLLEIRPVDSEDTSAKMYVRFVTESLLYNIATGNADGVLKLEYGEITANLSIKDLLILFLYCEGQVKGYYKKTENNKTVSRDVKIPTSVALCVPYKKSFTPIGDFYKWRNIDRYAPYVLRIVPEEITLYIEGQKLVEDSDTGDHVLSPTLPEYAAGVYRLSNPESDRSEWKWVSDNGSNFYYNADGLWVFNVAFSTDGVSATCSVPISYWNWLCWHPAIVFTSERGESIPVNNVELKVTKFHYAMDDCMPNYTTYSYYDPDYPDEDLVHLIDKQATALIAMHQEYVKSGLSRQHAAYLQVLDDRTFRGIVQLNLSPYETFKAHITASNDLTTILSGFDYMSEDTRLTEYSYLADSIIKILYPIKSTYLEVGESQLNGTLGKIKDLLADLCSYNVAWVYDTGSFGNTVLDCAGSVTSDIVTVASGMEDISSIVETTTSAAYQSGMTDVWCYDPVYDKKYVWPDDNTSTFMQYLLSSLNLGLKDSTLEKAVTRYKSYISNGVTYNPPANKLSLDLMNTVYKKAIDVGYDPFTQYSRPILYDTAIDHVCNDHQYIISSSIESTVRTVVTPIEYGENGAQIGHTFTVLLNLPESATPETATYSTNTWNMTKQINETIDEILTTREEHSDISGYKDIISVYGKDKVTLLLSMMFHLKFREMTITSRVDEDTTSYAYIKPSQGIQVSIKPNTTRK